MTILSIVKRPLQAFPLPLGLKKFPVLYFAMNSLSFLPGKFANTLISKLHTNGVKVPNGIFHYEIIISNRWTFSFGPNGLQLAQADQMYFYWNDLVSTQVSEVDETLLIEKLELTSLKRYQLLTNNCMYFVKMGCKLGGVKVPKEVEDQIAAVERFSFRNLFWRGPSFFSANH